MARGLGHSSLRRSQSQQTLANLQELQRWLSLLPLPALALQIKVFQEHPLSLEKEIEREKD